MGRDELRLLENELVPVYVTSTGEKVVYGMERPVVFAEELHKHLSQCTSFCEFFIEVSKLKVGYDQEELRLLLKEVEEYIPIYGAEVITYLKDCIMSEMIIPCKSKEAIDFTEANMKKEIVNNFTKAFPNYTFVETEKRVNGIGRIDIFALSGKRPVIMELKVKHKNPNGQLLAYATEFLNPILIGITQETIPLEGRLPQISYFTLDEIKSGIEEWVS